MNLLNRMVMGLTLVGIGALFLLSQIGIVENVNIGDIFKTYWPVIIIYMALSGLFYQKRLQYGWIGSYLWNFVVLFIGCYFLGRNLGMIEIPFGELVKYSFPIMIILFGLAMIIKPSRPHREHGRRRKDKHMDWMEDGISGINEGINDGIEGVKEGFKEAKHHWHGQKNNWNWEHDHYFKHDSNTFNKSSFIGDIYIGQEYWELKPTNVSLFIGDTVFDLTNASIPFGETKIQISAFIGDVKVFIPNDMDVEVCVMSSSFIGDINVLDRHETGFLKSMNAESPYYFEADKKLRINVSMFIGDVVVKKVG